MVGDTVFQMFAALLRDSGTATPPISEQELQRLRIELNRLQALSEPLAAIKRGGDLTADVFLSVTGNDYYHVNGSATIQGLYQQPAGSVVWLEFDNAITLQNSATLILQDNKDFTTHAGDVFGFIAENDGVWREISRRLATSVDDTGFTDNDILDLVQTFLTDNADIEWLTDGWEITGNIVKEFPAPGAMVLIRDIPLGTSQTTIDFMNIPPTFKHLYMVVNLRGTAAVANSSFGIRFNADAGANYDFLQIFTNVAGVPGAATGAGVTSAQPLEATGGSGAAGAFSASHFTVADYLSNNFKSLEADGQLWVNPTTLYTIQGNALWHSLSPINQITLIPISLTAFAAGSRATLYGIM